MAGSGSSAALIGPKEHAIDGSLTLSDLDGYDHYAGSCAGSGGYSDISAGAAVTVRDGSGDVLATGELGVGEEDLYGCTFPFTVGGVPDTDFYEVEVSHRGGLTYSRQEMEDSLWTVEFSLGD